MSAIGVIARDKCLACHLRRLKLAYWAVHASPQLRERAVRRVTDRMNNHINSSKKARSFSLILVSNVLQISGLERTGGDAA